MKKLLTYIMLTLTLSSLFASAEGKKIIKWVDKNGVTQYGDRAPMPSKAKRSSVLNKQGVTIQRVGQKKDNLKQDKLLAEQTRHDHALLGSYNSIDEIEISRLRNTKIDQLALNASKEKYKLLNAELAKNNKILLGFAKKNEPIPTDTVAAIEKNTADIEKLDKQISYRKAIIGKTNQRYEKDKLRYAELASRKGRLNNIKYKNKNIAELQKWRNDAQKRIDIYESDVVSHKRADRAVPKHISQALLNASRERERADQEINAFRVAIKKNKEQFSR